MTSSLMHHVTYIKLYQLVLVVIFPRKSYQFEKVWVINMKNSNDVITVKVSGFTKHYKSLLPGPMIYKFGLQD